ncbi:MAG: respiratory nitrate reductase subunit [Rhodothalassiaceae bacterium]|nr:MAG: respiratory nitrate reductase subunit [Rhodothalassiaceae bacterium]
MTESKQPTLQDPALKALSLLLCYPDAQMRAALGEVRAVLAADPRLKGRLAADLLRLVDMLRQREQLDCEEEYVRLFDRSRALSLDLFEHVHGEARDRGQAMVDLLALYERHGFAPATRELPDHLPVFLEFLALRPRDEARDLLLQTTHILGALADRLAERKSPYAAVFQALVAIAGGRIAMPELATADAPDPGDLAALDREWEEQPVTFGTGGCAASGLPRAAGTPG